MEWYISFGSFSQTLEISYKYWRWRCWLQIWGLENILCWNRDHFFHFWLFTISYILTRAKTSLSKKFLFRGCNSKFVEQICHDPSFPKKCPFLKNLSPLNNRISLDISKMVSHSLGWQSPSTSYIYHKQNIWLVLSLHW